MKNQMRESREQDAIIAIVDDDPSVRRGLERLIRSAGWKAETFASAQEFLARADVTFTHPDSSGCPFSHSERGRG